MSSAGRIRITGSKIGIAPAYCKAFNRSTACAAARVTTTCLPESIALAASATLTAHLFQNFSCTRAPKQLRDLMAEFASLFQGPSTSLANLLFSIGRTDDGIKYQLTAFKTCPRAKWDLASALQCTEQCTLRNNRLAGFEIVKLRNSFRHFLVPYASLNTNCALANSWHENIWAESFRNARAQAEAVKSGLGKQNCVVFTAF